MIAMTAICGLSLTGCRDDTVEIAFHPAIGARHAYRVSVHAETITDLVGMPERRTSSSFDMEALHEVIEVGETGTTVRVLLSVAGEPERTLVVKLDRAAQLAEVQEVEGLPAATLGDLGLTEIFPAAAGAPPERPLAPGDRWVVDEPLRLPRAAATRLRGIGRLVELGYEDGRDVATVETSYQLPISRLTEGDPSVVVLDGTQTTKSRTTHDLADGSIVRARAVSTGRYDLSLRPPGGGEGPGVTGTLIVEVRSTTRRVEHSIANL